MSVVIGTGMVAGEKLHWCHACRAFKPGRILRCGWWKRERVCCATCETELGSPT